MKPTTVYHLFLFVTKREKKAESKKKEIQTRMPTTAAHFESLCPLPEAKMSTPVLPLWEKSVPYGLYMSHTTAPLYHAIFQKPVTLVVENGITNEMFAKLKYLIERQLQKWRIVHGAGK
jgi:hypothetical protein